MGTTQDNAVAGDASGATLGQDAAAPVVPRDDAAPSGTHAGGQSAGQSGGLYGGFDEEIRAALALHLPAQTNGEQTNGEHTRGEQAGCAANETGPIARVTDLHKSFGKLNVLSGLDLEFERGKTTVILGPSGTGKSVLLKHIVGLIKPDQGEVYFEGQRVDTMAETELVAIRRRIGYMFQLGALFDSMTVGENVAFPLVEHTKMSDEHRAACVERVLGLVGLEGFQDKMPADLSGGQQRRVALARAVVLQPCLVLYDEPTTGLDPVRADVINELILALTRQMGITSIVVTHDIASANKVADRIVLVHGGGVICDGTPDQVRASTNTTVQRFIRGEADEQDIDAIRRAFAGQTTATRTTPNDVPTDVPT